MKKTVTVILALLFAFVCCTTALASTVDATADETLPMLEHEPIWAYILIFVAAVGIVIASAIVITKKRK